jgi:NADH:ubiquinone oxidoreductase subunit 6 (subunit J)
MIGQRQALAVAAVAALFLVMAISFIGVPWPTTQHQIDVVNTSAPGGNAIANSLFNAYSIALILIAVILAAAMVGGVFLAKMEGGKLGP